MENKKYYKRNNKNNYKKNNKSKDIDNSLSTKKLTYDEIVNVRKDASELNINNDNRIATYRFIAVSVILLTIIFVSLILFRVL